MGVTPLKLKFGSLLQRYIKDKGKKQNDIASMLGVTSAAVSQVMHGKNTLNQNQLEMIIEWLELPRRDAIVLAEMLENIRNGESDILSPFNRTFFSLRSENKLTVPEIASQTGISNARVMAFEKNCNARPTYDEIMRLCEVFHCRREELLQVSDVSPDVALRITPSGKDPFIGVAGSDFVRRANPVPLVQLYFMKKFRCEMDPLEFACDHAKQLILLRDKWANAPAIAVEATGTEIGLAFSGIVRLLLSERPPRGYNEFVLSYTQNQNFILQEKQNKKMVTIRNFGSEKDSSDIVWSLPILELTMMPVAYEAPVSDDNDCE